MERDVGKSLGERLRAKRHELGLAQDVVAASAGISQEYLSELEGGKKEPSLAVLRRLASTLGESSGFLLNGG